MRAVLTASVAFAITGCSIVGPDPAEFGQLMLGSSPEAEPNAGESSDTPTSSAADSATVYDQSSPAGLSEDELAYLTVLFARAGEPFDLSKIPPDTDGDAIPNVVDPDADGDGLENAEDEDVDGDGEPNDEDADIDGDGFGNDDDLDIDGDGEIGDDDGG